MRTTFRDSAAFLFFCGLVVVGAMAFPGPAYPQPAPYCDTRDSIIAELATKYDEHRHGVGIVSGNQVVETFVAESGTWTILVTHPLGRSCVLVAGQHWRDVAPPIPGTDS